MRATTSPSRPRLALKATSAVIAAAFLAFGSSSMAQPVETDPVGAVTLTLVGNSDTRVSLPLVRPPIFEGVVSSYNAGVITFSSNPNWSTNALVRAAGTQPNTYYLLLGSDGKEGAFFTVTANTSNSVTVDLAGETLSSAHITSGTIARIIPYYTLGTLFPAGTGVHGSATHGIGARQSEVLFPTTNSAGIDLASSSSYYYYTGANAPGAGWRRVGVTGVIANDDIIAPNQFVVVRHNIAQSTTLTVLGNVNMAKSFARLRILSSNVAQDNYVGLPVATPLSIGSLNLLTAGFVGSSTHGIAARQDQVLLFDNTSAGKDKAASASYYYYSGANAPGPGWRRAGETGRIANDDIVFLPGEALVIRKKSATAVSNEWSILPSYLN